MVYGTYGQGCEHYRFKKIGETKDFFFNQFYPNEMSLWVKVKKINLLLFSFWWGYGEKIYDYDNMFYPLKSEDLSNDCKE